MRLTTKGRYAVTAMLDLALNSTSGPVSLAHISRRQEISLSYLEQLFSKLRQSGLVRSVRGPGGGYRLNKTVDEVYVAEIIDAVNESVDATNCKGDGNCQHGEVCLTHHLWSELSDRIHDFLSDISLGDMVSSHDVQKVSLRQNEKSGLLDAPLEGIIPSASV